MKGYFINQLERVIENLILHKRFINVEQLEKVLSDFFKKEIKLSDSTLEDLKEVDYSLVVDLTENKNYAYLEIYYLKMRNDGLYITEVNYVEE